MDITEKPEVLSLFDTSVAPRYSPKPLKTIWPCHPFALVMGVSMIPSKSQAGHQLRAAIVGHRICVFELELARSWHIYPLELHRRFQGHTTWNQWEVYYRMLCGRQLVLYLTYAFFFLHLVPLPTLSGVSYAHFPVNCQRSQHEVLGRLLLMCDCREGA